MFSLDDGGGIFSETSANARIAPQKTVLVVSSKFLKCSCCIKNATKRAQSLSFVCVCVCVAALILPSGREAAKFKLRVAHGASAYFFGPPELAPPSVMCCNYCSAQAAGKYVYTPECSDPVTRGCYKPDKLVSRSSTYIFNTTCRLSLPRCLFPSILPPEVTTYSLSVMCATCERPAHPRQFDRTHNIY